MKTAKLAKPTITLRPYQETDVINIETAWKEYRSVLYQLPTGGGKGIVITKLISDYQDEETIIFAHKRKLLKQLHKNLAKIGITAGLMIGQTAENIDAKILLVSIRTAVKTKRLEPLMKRPWKRCFIDEGRHSRTGSYDIVLDRMIELHPTYKLLGVDATPYRKDGKRLDKHFQTMVVSCESIKSLQEKGFLAKERTYATPIGEIKEQVKELANDYQQTALSNYMRQPKYLNYVVDAYTKYGEKRQAIVFAVDKAHSKDLLKVFIEKGYESVRQIDSDLSESEIDQVYEDYENNKIQILINVEMLTEGVDLPETGCIVGARPTKSLTLYLQMAGRGTRPKKDGSDLIIIDCAGWTEEFGTISSSKEWSLDPEVDPNDPRKKNRIVGKDKNGNLTTDVAEMDEFTELVEMTPEEYIGKVQGGLKAAEKQNMTIDEKIHKVEDELAELLHKVAIEGLKEKISPFMGVVRQSDHDDDVLQVFFFHKSRYAKKTKRNSEEEIDAWIDETHVVEMDLGKKENMYASLHPRFMENEYYRRNDRKASVKEFREMSQVCGSVNSQIMDNKNLMMQILEKHQTIHDLRKSKINIAEYRDLEEKFKRTQWLQSIEQHLKTSNTFLFKKDLSKDNYFKGYSRDRIVGITIPNNTINKYNTILIKLKNHWNDNAFEEEKKFIKEEKIHEMLEDGQWNKEPNVSKN
jgi:superfamily II DNA or RNA helicase